jgi:hypothetical protein
MPLVGSPGRVHARWTDLWGADPRVGTERV